MTPESEKIQSKLGLKNKTLLYCYDTFDLNSIKWSELNNGKFLCVRLLLKYHELKPWDFHSSNNNINNNAGKF